MTAYTESLVESLETLNHISETLNQSLDATAALDSALAQLIELMGLETGWIFLRDPSAQTQWHGRGYVLAAHTNLPPALALHKASAWKGGCDCQGFCSKGKLIDAYNEVRCSRLMDAKGEDRRGLVVHASAPLRSGNRLLGILNVAAPNWAAFTPEALALLTNVGSQMGIALERGRLYDLLQEQRIDEQAALLDLSNQLLSRSDLTDMMSYLVGEVRRLLQVDACALLLPCDEPSTMNFRAANGWRQNPVSDQRRVVEAEWDGPSLVMEAQTPMLLEDSDDGREVLGMPSWLLEEGFRGHSIVPLIVEGRSVGTLMINSRRPRLMEEDEVRFLQLMANQAAIAIEEARLREEAIRHERLAEELKLGRQIQLSMLPKASPVLPGWEFRAIYQAARIVGGDFYDYFDLSGQPSRLGMVIADVADKGVPAALFMALSRTIIRTVGMSGRSPSATLTEANRLILKDSQTDLFLSAFYAILESETGRMVYTNAGHNRPLWYQASTGDVQELITRGIVLGAFDQIELEQCHIDLAPGDVVVFYTDGLTEALSSTGEMLGTQALSALIAANAQGSAEDLAQSIVEAYNDFTMDMEQSDDVTFLVLKRSPKSGSHTTIRS